MIKLTDSLVNSSGISFTGDDDPQLIGDALPFTIKMYESLLEKDSTNARLYIATSKLLCLYAQYFIVFPIDTMQDLNAKKASGKRAKKLFLRARNYSLKSLDLTTPGLRNLIIKGSIDTAMDLVKPHDTTALFWCAASWLGAIGADRSDFSLAMGIMKPLTLAKKVITFDSTYSDGLAHEILGVATINVPKSLGGGLDNADRYFKDAVVFSKRSRSSTFVLYASTVAVKRGNREKYLSFLNEALSVDIKLYPANRLANIIYQEKARQLINNVTAIFPDTVVNE